MFDSYVIQKIKTLESCIFVRLSNLLIITPLENFDFARNLLYRGELWIIQCQELQFEFFTQMNHI